jgi:regulator of protease activity HflC (stomatin/prohibitin superfamily)
MFPFLFFKTVVKENERAFLYRNGVFVRLLEPGLFKVFDPSGKYRSETFNVVRDRLDSDKALLLEKTHPDLAAKHLVIVQPGPGEVVLVTLDGETKYLALPNTTRAFWKTITLVETQVIDIADTYRVEKTYLNKLGWVSAQTITNDIIDQHEVGLLFIDGELKEQLQPGRHAFWAVERDVRISKVDLRPQSLEVTAQEILTKDRVGIRVTLTAFYKVIDAAKSVANTQDVAATLYRLVQFAIREAVATRTLDDILAARDQLDSQVRDFVTKRAGELGVEIGEIGVKDVILPGDVRELLNKVVEAERTAKANLIRRQEETAATRSLLNTSKLMQDNPLLLRLKELEALEKLVEKVGRIDLHAGGGGAGLDTLLTNLYRLRQDKDEG